MSTVEDDPIARRIVESARRQVDCVSQMQSRSGPLYELAKERSRIMSAAWRAAGSPRDPQRIWDKAMRHLKIPDGERYDVWVGSERLGEDLPGDAASDLLWRLQHSPEHAERWVGDFDMWPRSAEPFPADPKDRGRARMRWYRALGVTVPHPTEDTPERRAWQAWLRQRAHLSIVLGLPRGRLTRPPRPES